MANAAVAALAKTIKAALVADEASALVAIGAIYAPITVGLNNLLNNFKPSGFAAVVWTFVKTPAQNYVNGLIAQYGPQQAYDFLIRELTLLGG
jgi:hypothetical protein